MGFVNIAVFSAQPDNLRSLDLHGRGKTRYLKVISDPCVPPVAHTCLSHSHTHTHMFTHNQ